ncbi:ABC transporter ATP-binding protein/permease [Myxococcota bacterium]|nr:ABC transporter ATP-binding protein/permease [Myxococcota bacterium]
MSMPKVIAGRRRHWVGLLIANGVAQALCGFGLAFSLRELMREAEAGALAWPWLGTMIGLGLLVLLLRVRESSDAERLGQDYVTRVRLRIFERVTHRPHAPVGGRRFGVTLTRLTGDLNSLRNWVSLGIARSVVSGFSIAGLLVGLAYFSPVAALVSSGVIVALGVSWALAIPWLRNSVREGRRRRGRLANYLSEKVLASRAVLKLGRADDEQERIRRDSGRLRDALVRRARWSALLRSTSELAWPVTIVTVLASMVATARPISELVVAVLLSGMIVTALGQIARAFDYRIAFEEGRRRIAEALSEPRIREARGAIALPGTGALQLEIDAVGVAGVFERLDLRAAPGERILVLGPTGSGKSILLGLAARLRDPDSGEVRLDGIPLPGIELDSLHAAVQLVSTHLPLLRGTVGENVRYGSPGEDEAWIERVAATCGLFRDPALAELGLETRVDEQGANLPQGLRQRILLARAIAMKPRLLLVDEPGLLADAQSLEELERGLDLLEATVLIVGGRPGDGPQVDWIWTLPAGRAERPTRAPNVIEGIRWSAGISGE